MKIFVVLILMTLDGVQVSIPVDTRAHCLELSRAIAAHVKSVNCYTVTRK